MHAALKKTYLSYVHIGGWMSRLDVALYVTFYVSAKARAVG